MKLLKRNIHSTKEMNIKYYNGCLEGKLYYQKCQDCSEIIFPLREICPECKGHNLTMKTSSGKGKIGSITIIDDHSPYNYIVTGEDIPYASVIVDMEEGFRIHSNMVECDIGKLHCGMTVEVFFDLIAKGSALPRFRLA